MGVVTRVAMLRAVSLLLLPRPGVCASRAAHLVQYKLPFAHERYSRLLFMRLPLRSVVT